MATRQKTDPKPSTEITKTVSQASDMVVMSDEVPEYLRQDSDRGSEGVGADDLVVPRLELVQALSPARDRQSPEYVPGAEEGHLFNSITRRLYGESVMVVPVFFRHQYAVWVKREKGTPSKGTFRGSFPTEQAARERVAAGREEGESLEIIDLHEHFVLIVSEAGVEEAVVAMQRSKARVSKRWNSLIRLAGGDRFSRVYKVSAVQEQNATGDRFHNLRIEVAGYPSKPLYERATALYDSIKTMGRTVHAPTADDEEVGAPAAAEGAY